MKTLTIHRARLSTGPGVRLVPVLRCAIRFPDPMPRFNGADPTASEEMTAHEAGELYAFLRDVLPTGTLYRLEYLIRNQPAKAGTEEGDINAERNGVSGEDAP